VVEESVGLHQPAFPAIELADHQPGVRQTEVLAPETPFANLPDDSQFELADLQVVTGALRDGAWWWRRAARR